MDYRSVVLGGALWDKQFEIKIFVEFSPLKFLG